ncbi:MAG: septal ring lytic transglycosylase RlpA family protein [Spirochaetes bacterium]|nr:septal ring lytic transglycosylase RlpA family protein [Spirochaetota bacterium]
MIKIVRGFGNFTGIALIILLLTACSSDGVFAKKDRADQRSRSFNSASDKEEFIYDDEAINKPDIEPQQYSDMSRSGRIVDVNSYNTDGSENGNYYQRGYASWYGREFHGRKTASGERYDMNKLTAAHKKLPFGTRILVKNLENDKTVSVMINDRGPYRDNRILDLSYAAAKKLGIVASGEANVGIKIIKSESEERFSDKQSYTKSDINPVAGYKDEEEDSDNYIEDNIRGSYSVQAGAFYSRRNAERLQQRLEDLVDNPVVMTKDNDLYKVKIDKLNSRKEANKVKSQLEMEEIPSYIIDNQK